MKPTMYNYPDPRQLEFIFTYGPNKKLFTLRTSWRFNYELHIFYNRFRAYTAWIDIITNINIYKYLKNVKKLEILQNEIEISYKHSPLRFNKPILLHYKNSESSSRILLSHTKCPTLSNYFMEISASTYFNREFTFYHELSHIILHQLQQNTMTELNVLTKDVPKELTYHINHLFAESFSDIWALILLKMHNKIELHTYIFNIITRRTDNLEDGIKAYKYYLAIKWISPFGHDTRESLYYLHEQINLITNNINNIRFLNQLVLHIAYVGILRTLRRLIELPEGYKIHEFINTNLLNDTLSKPHFKFKSEYTNLIKTDMDTDIIDTIIDSIIWIKRLFIPVKQNKLIPQQLELF